MSNSNEITSFIKGRRSIRSFIDKEIPEEVIQDLMECGLAAPSSKNSNPWFFVVVTGEQKDQIAQWIEDGAKKSAKDRVPVSASTGEMAEGAFDTVAESVQTIREAYALIVVLNRGPLSGGKEEVLENPRGGRSLYTYAGEIIGIGAAVQNIMLAAKSHGLGAVYMADSYPGRVQVQKALKTDAEQIGSIAIGYPAYDPPPRDLEADLYKDWEDSIGAVPTENFTAKKM